MGESGRRVARAFLLAVLGIGLVGMGAFVCASAATESPRSPP